MKIFVVKSAISGWGEDINTLGYFKYKKKAEDFRKQEIDRNREMKLKHKLCSYCNRDDGFTTQRCFEKRTHSGVTYCANDVSSVFDGSIPNIWIDEITVQE